jgi:hypothetical protein
MNILRDSKNFSKQLAGVAVILGMAVSVSGAGFQQYPSQQDGQNNGQNRGRSAIVGGWHSFRPNPNGGTLHIFEDFEPDGRFMLTSIFIGGPQNGLRTEVWGRYAAVPGNEGYAVTMTVQNYAPKQLCMPGQNCSQTMQPPPVMRSTIQIQGNRLIEGDTVSERAAVPAVLLQQLPAVWRLQPPPPLPPTVSGTAGGGGGYVSPKNNIPGLGGNCDDAQQSRICFDGGQGYYHKDANTGCMVCSK